MENKIKARLKSAIIEQAELILNNHLLHAKFQSEIDPGPERQRQLDAALAACEEIMASLAAIDDASSVGYDALWHSLPHLEGSIKALREEK